MEADLMGIGLLQTVQQALGQHFGVWTEYIWKCVVQHQKLLHSVQL
jgi:hypothetical protein